MTREEVIKILSVLQTAYPMFYRNQTQEQIRSVVNLWEQMFKDREYEIVSGAVNALIATRTETYPPTIGSVNEMISKMTEPEITPMEAWSYVRRALRNGIYDAEYEWSRLPDGVRESITPDQIRAWAMDEEFNEGVASSNFMRSYTARDKNRRQYNMLPADIQKLMLAVSNRLQIAAK